MNTPVSFELSKLLKEKGFHQHHEFSKGYTKNGDLFHQGYGDLNKTQDYFQAPTIAEVIMWLYEKHGIWISVQPNEPYVDDDWCFTIFKDLKNNNSLEGYNSPIEAYEAGIEYTLNIDMNTTMTTEERLARIEAHLFGKAEQPQEEPLPKTRIEWLNELPDGYRERALVNCVEWEGGKPTDERKSMSIAIGGMCYLSKTPEGDDFWLAVCEHYEKGTPLPPLPDEVEFPSPEAIDKAVSAAFSRLPTERTIGNSEKPNDLPTLEEIKEVLLKCAATQVSEGERLNDYRNYALCVGEGQFVRAMNHLGLILVVRAVKEQVTLDEVTPI